jgi:alpha-glucoside transport system substrate-binding protein
MAKDIDGMILWPVLARINAITGILSPVVWDEAGYEFRQPGINDALSKHMVEDGDTPRCIGIESGGERVDWTDWIEDILLRTVTPTPLNNDKAN